MLPKQPHHLTRFGVAFGGFFAVDQGVADGDFKSSAAGGDQGQADDGLGEMVEQLCRQTDGAWGVVSHHAVFDTDRNLLHGCSFSG